MQHIKSFVISRQRESEKRQIDGDLAHVALTLERRGWKEEELMITVLVFRCEMKFQYEMN